MRILSYSLRSGRSESPATTNPARPSTAAAILTKYYRGIELKKRY